MGEAGRALTIDQLSVITGFRWKLRWVNADRLESHLFKSA